MTIDEFQKMELKVGRIISAERVEGSDKLLKLQVDLGPSSPLLGSNYTGQSEASEGHSGPGEDQPRELRQVLSGIAKRYAPEDLMGKEIVLVANLDPRAIMGMESQGMILAAQGGDGRPVALTPMQEVPPGSKIA